MEFPGVEVHPTAVVEPGATIGAGSTIGPLSFIREHVVLGSDSTVDSHCVLGHTEPGAPAATLTIGPDARIRSHTVIYGGTEIGPGLETGHGVTIREDALIGVSFRVGTQSDIQGHCSIGDFVRFHSNVHIGQLSRISDYVHIFPYVVLTNDPHPPSDGFLSGVTVEEYAAIATMSVVLPGVTIGSDSLVGAGAVVNRDVRSGSVVAGVPAREVSNVDEIMLRDKSGPAYPWRRHFGRGYPAEVVAQWREEFDTELG